MDSCRNIFNIADWFNPRARPVFFPRIDDSHCNIVQFSFTAVHCFDNGYVGKQPLTWKEYCAEYWLKEVKGGMNRCTGDHDIIEILLKMAFHTIQSSTKLKTFADNKNKINVIEKIKI